jgi:hypothetical protein
MDNMNTKQKPELELKKKRGSLILRKRKQWRKWSLPSKYGVIGTIITIAAFFFSLFVYFSQEKVRVIVIESEKQFQEIRKHVDVRTDKYQYTIGEDLSFTITNLGSTDIVFPDDPLCRWGLQVEEDNIWRTEHYIDKSGCNIDTHGADIRLHANGGTYSKTMESVGVQGHVLKPNKKYKFVFWYSPSEMNLSITEPLLTNSFIITD